MAPQPPRTLLPELEKLLAKRPAKVAEAVRRTVLDVRPCVRLTTTRANQVPINGSLYQRLLGKPPPPPVLSVLASKFGGVPYVEKDSELEGERRFLGQINFAEVRRNLAAQDFPVPDGLPLAGILGVDLTNDFKGRVRWYPTPDEARVAQPRQLNAVAKYEAAIAFKGSWSLRGLEWFDAIPKEDEELWDAMNDLEIAGVDEDAHGGHKLLGHPNEVLNEHYGLEPVAGRSDAIREYALLWRIDFDHAAGFSWGTNWIYVVIHREDLARGAIGNAVVTGANA